MRSRMMRSVVCLLALFCCAGAAFASPEEAETSAKLTSEATEFLDQLLGPGRARVVVSVEGEKSEIRTESEVVTPIRPPKPPGAPEDKILPGYVDNSDILKQRREKKAAEEESSPDTTIQKDKEQSLRVSGLIIKKIHVSVILDKTLTQAQVATVRQVLPDFLHLSADRGDEMTVLQAPLRTAWEQTYLTWQRLLMTMEGMHALLRIAAILVLTLWLSIVAYVIAIRVVKTFVREMAAARREAQQAQPHIPGADEKLPELMPGGLPSLEEEEEARGLEGETKTTPAIGQRFDFLSSKGPDEIALLLAKEPAKDLALVFGYLAASNPNLATRIFIALPSVVQGEVSQELVKLTIVDPERLAMLESRVKGLVDFGVQGAERLSQILNRLPPEKREELLGDIMSQDTANLERLEAFLFPFERLADLPDAELRRLISSAAYQDWGIALRGAPRDLVDRVLGLLPVGPRTLLAEAIEVPQPRDKVLEARSRILTLAFELNAKGQIALKRSGLSKDLI